MLMRAIAGCVAFVEGGGCEGGVLAVDCWVKK